ncbi:hypothetical protein BDR26DRAFT_857644 [Obelidium mucronatum]|nr:hypothetical protein BDR26DRAFT_857644 [Obelidium mucronatum]
MIGCIRTSLRITTTCSSSIDRIRCHRTLSDSVARLLELGQTGKVEAMVAGYYKLPDGEKNEKTVTLVLRELSRKQRPKRLSAVIGGSLKEPPIDKSSKTTPSQVSRIANGIVEEWRGLNYDQIPDLWMLKSLLLVHATHSSRNHLFETLRLILKNYPRRSKQFPLDAETIGILIQACALKVSKPHLRLMNKLWDTLQNNTRQYPYLDIRIFENLCKGYSRARALDQLETLVERMESRHHVKPNHVIYSIVIHAFGGAARLEEMMVWLVKMRKSGVGVDHAVYNTCITAFGKAGEIVRMEEMYFELMEGLSSGSVSPSLTRSSLLNLKLQAQHNRRQLEITFTTLIEGYSLAGCFGKVAWVHGEMKRFGINSRAISVVNR